MNGGERMDSGETLFIEERERVRKWMTAASATQEENGLLPPLKWKMRCKSGDTVDREIDEERDGGRGREREYGSMEILAFFTHHQCVFALFDFRAPHSMVSFLYRFCFTIL